MTTATYADLLDLRRPTVARLSAATETMPALTPELLHLADGALAALRQASGEIPVPELAVESYAGRHRPGLTRVADDWSPWTAEEREAIRWSLRRSLLDTCDTGVIPAIRTGANQ